VQTILHSLKRAGPLLLNVAWFVLFAMVLFSIIGVQSFQGSLRRSCYVVDDPTNLKTAVSLSKSCGGWYDPTLGTNRGYVFMDDATDTGAPKGFICPGPNQMCIQSTSFDSLPPPTPSLTWPLTSCSGRER
jgi:hypothetical protein